MVVVVATSVALHGEIIDGLAAVVGLKAVTYSEVGRELRLEALFNMVEIDTTTASRKAALSRLIERRLIRQDLELAAYLVADPGEVGERMRGFHSMRFAAGRDFSVALRHYGLSESECRDFIAEQISFERYIAFRFKTGLDATDEEIADYYETVYEPRQQLLGTTAEAFDEISERIKQLLIELQADRLLNERVRELRAITRVEVLAEGLGNRP